MLAIISAIVASIVMILLISFLSYAYFIPLNKKIVKGWQFITLISCLSIFTIISLVFVVMYNSWALDYKDEVVMNLEFSLMIVSILGTFFFVKLNNNRSTQLGNSQNISQKLGKISMWLDLPTAILDVLIFAIWVGLTIAANYFEGSKDEVQDFISSNLMFLAWIALATGILAFLLLISKVALSIASLVKSDKNSNILITIANLAFVVIGYSLTVVAIFMLFASILQVRDDNRLGSQLIGLLTNMYTNSLSYCLIYFSLTSIICVLIDLPIRKKPSLH